MRAPPKTSNTRRTYGESSPLLSPQNQPAPAPVPISRTASPLPTQRSETAGTPTPRDGAALAAALDAALGVAPGVAPPGVVVAPGGGVAGSPMHTPSSNDVAGAETADPKARWHEVVADRGSWCAVVSAACNITALFTEGVVHTGSGVGATASAAVGYGVLSHKLGTMQGQQKKDHGEAMKAIRDQAAQQNTDNEAAIVRHEAHMALLQANHEEAMNTRPNWFFW